jgi:hypothetical protein
MQPLVRRQDGNECDARGMGGGMNQNAAARAG